MEGETRQLVGAIGLTGTTGHYAAEARSERRTADLWRWIAIVIALLAVIPAAFATFGDHTDTRTFVGKVVMTFAIGAVAAFAAGQSIRHRRREERARERELELAAFGPFIEPLIAEQREEERVIFTRKTFGKTAPREKVDEEPGPTAVSFLLRRREQRDEEGE